jgi:DNA-binding CsgD family transcriptional regulator
LRSSAALSVALGAPQPAVAQLRRALAEPPPLEVRAEVLRELGRAEATLGEPEAAGRLAAAAELTADPRERAQILRELARARVSQGDHAGAREAYATALAALNGNDQQLGAHLRAEELVVAALDPANRPDAAVQQILAHEDVGATPAGRALLATLAVHELYAGAPRERLLALVDRALEGGALLTDDGAETTTLHGVSLVLFLCEELARCDALATELMATARTRGSVTGLASAAFSRGWARLLACRVTDALDDAQQSVDAGRHGWKQFLPGAFGLMTHALLDAGEGDQAEAQLREAEALEGPEQVLSMSVLDARGRVHALRGRHAEAAADFLAAGEMAGPQRNPLLFATWRSNAGLAIARTGDRDRARELVEAELELAHGFGAPRGLAVAQRALGVIDGGKLGLELLEESVRVLEHSEAHLERGRSLLELGGALRRAGKRTDAGKILGEALEIARAGGAGDLERRASEELAVAGARATRAARRGREALSPSERRVAQLAAEGLSNREIAEELFVTRKAVEWHLRNSYVKLGISSRRDLPAALKLD